AVMTYYNIAYHMGLERFARSLRRSGIAGAILPDMPLSEAGPWTTAANDAQVESVLMVAPTTTARGLGQICERSQGFVYAVGLLGVTGVREELARSATAIAKRCKAVTDKPVLVGVGVGTPGQAAQVAEVADGCVVGTAVVRSLMDGGPDAVGELVTDFRSALDAG
ncbi:MAG: tryptophan synthase subunit alpha, partial [Acidimicrobiales bacterium]